MKKLLLTLTIILGLAGPVYALNNSGLSATSPYWQADADSYSFISISHPSLASSASQIGVRVTANITGGATSASTQTGFTEFTIAAGKVQRVFVVTTNHSTVNAANFSTNASFIGTSTNPSFGTLVIAPLTTAATTKSTTGNGDGDGLRVVTLLKMWGAIIVPSSNAGFAMDFLGDAADSMQ